MTSIIEPARNIPIAHDVDVVVAGGGAAGFAAAVAAAREGASTVLVESFGTLGGCMSVGGWNAGGFSIKDLNYEKFRKTGWSGYLTYLATKQEVGDETLDQMRTCGLAGEWMTKIFDMDDDYGPRHNLADTANRIGYICGQMVHEAGVTMMLNTYAADVIQGEDRVVRGLIVENTSGRQAIRAKVVIDATANAAIAARSGAPLMDNNWEPSLNITFGYGNIDAEKWQKFVAQRPEVPAEFNEWIDNELLPQAGYTWFRVFAHINRLRPIADLVRQAQENDGYHAIGKISEAGRIALVFPWEGGKAPKNGMYWGRADIDGKIDTLSAEDMTMVEREARRYLMETGQFFRKYLPGFENCYLLYSSAYIGKRGGRAIEAERVITPEDMFAARRLDDVISLHDDSRYHTAHKPRGGMHDPDELNQPTDIPYRQLLPKRVENLLAAGVSAHRKPPNIRERTTVIVMGQAAGIAATIAARQDVFVRDIDVRHLQRRLQEEGVYLGPAEHVEALLKTPAKTSLSGPKNRSFPPIK